MTRHRLLKPAIFGLSDGMMSLLGVVLYLLGHQALILPAALPALPFAVGTGAGALTGMVVICLGIGLLVAWMRTGRSRSRSLAETAAVLALIFGVVLGCGLLLPGAAA